MKRTNSEDGSAAKRVKPPTITERFLASHMGVDEAYWNLLNDQTAPFGFIKDLWRIVNAYAQPRVWEHRGLVQVDHDEGWYLRRFDHHESMLTFFIKERNLKIRFVLRNDTAPDVTSTLKFGFKREGSALELRRKDSRSAIRVNWGCAEWPAAPVQDVDEWPVRLTDLSGRYPIPITEAFLDKVCTVLTTS